MTSLVIGRDESCDIVLEDSFVSRRHVRLELSEDGGCLLKDLGSTNGTFVFKDAGYVTVREAAVEPTDHIRIGHLDYTVSQLVKLARRPLWLDSVEPVRPTRELSRTALATGISNDPSMRLITGELQQNQRWHPVSSVAFVITANLLFWGLVLYFFLYN